VGLPASAADANVTGGFGAEVVARVAEAAGPDLACRPLRIGARDTRIAASPALSAAVLPTPERVAADLLRWLGQPATATP
jgi:acetoin:2,6-dichlorophenolindophenol oxidoreductase subunit beta